MITFEEKLTGVAVSPVSFVTAPPEPASVLFAIDSGLLGPDITPSVSVPVSFEVHFTSIAFKTLSAEVVLLSIGVNVLGIAFVPMPIAVITELVVIAVSPIGDTVKRVAFTSGSDRINANPFAFTQNATDFMLEAFVFTTMTNIFTTMTNLFKPTIVVFYPMSDSFVSATTIFASTPTAYDPKL